MFEFIRNWQSAITNRKSLEQSNNIANNKRESIDASNQRAAEMEMLKASAEGARTDIQLDAW